MEASLISSIILGVIGLAITYIYSRHSTNLAQNQMMKELIRDFNIRYSQLNDSLSEIEVRETGKESYDITDDNELAEQNTFAFKPKQMPKL